MKPSRSTARAGKRRATTAAGPRTLALWIALAAVAIASAGCRTVPVDNEVKRARAEFREDQQFYRISEFFTERENTGGAVIVRSQPDERAGYYFTVRLARYPYHKETVEEAVRVQVIVPGELEPRLYSFPLGPAKKKNPLLLIGLTGSDWPDRSVRPLAWHLAFHNDEGERIATAQSFLWSIEEDR